MPITNRIPQQSLIQNLPGGHQVHAIPQIGESSLSSVRVKNAQRRVESPTAQNNREEMPSFPTNISTRSKETPITSDSTQNKTSDWRLVDKEGNNVLHHAARSNVWVGDDQVCILIETLKNEPQFDVNQPNQNGDTAVHLALEAALQADPRHYDKVIQRLEALTWDADYNRAGSHGTPMEMVDAALNAKDDPNRQQYYLNLRKWLEKRKPLTEEDVKQMLARGVKDFSGTNLENLYLSGLRFHEGSDFSKANMRWISLNKSVIEQSYFFETDLSQANLDGARLLYNDFTSANLSSATAAKALLCDSQLSGANMRGINLNGATLDGVFSRENHPPDMTRAIARRSSWGGSWLPGLRADEINLEDATISYYHNPTNSNRFPAHGYGRLYACWKRAHLQGSVAKKADFSWGEFDGADISNSHWTCMKYLPCDLSHAIARKTDFSGSHGMYVNFSKADLTEAKLCALSNGRGFIFTDAILDKTDLTEYDVLREAIKQGGWKGTIIKLDPDTFTKVIWTH